MNASFEEKSVWVQLISMVTVLGGYFVVAGKMMSAGNTFLPAYVPLFIAAVVLMVIVLTIGHILAAAFGVDRRDERDRLIEWRAESNSGWVLATGVLAAITGLVVSVESISIAHLLFFSLFLSKVIRYLLQIVYYRRGI